MLTRLLDTITYIWSNILKSNYIDDDNLLHSKENDDDLPPNENENNKLY